MLETRKKTIDYSILYVNYILSNYSRQLTCATSGGECKFSFYRRMHCNWFLSNSKGFVQKIRRRFFVIGKDILPYSARWWRRGAHWHSAIMCIYCTCTYCSTLPWNIGNVLKLEARKGLHLYLSDICEESYWIGTGNLLFQVQCKSGVLSVSTVLLFDALASLRLVQWVSWSNPIFIWK